MAGHTDVSTDPRSIDRPELIEWYHESRAAGTGVAFEDMTTGSAVPTVFISGAAAGIGRATALEFARRGYRVGAYDIDLGGLATLRDEITSAAATSPSEELDVTEATDWEEQLAAFTGASRRLDILVNNAGILSSGRFEIPLATQRKIVEVNVCGAMAGLHTAFPYLRGHPGRAGRQPVLGLGDLRPARTGHLLGEQIRRARPHRGAGTRVAPVRDPGDRHVAAVRADRDGRRCGNRQHQVTRRAPHPDDVAQAIYSATRGRDG